MSKDNSRLIKTICISGSSAVISYLINFFLTSFISENVGIEAYSFVSIAKTAVSYAQIITVDVLTVCFPGLLLHRSVLPSLKNHTYLIIPFPFAYLQ